MAELRYESPVSKAAFEPATPNLNPFRRKCRILQLYRFIVLNVKILKVALFPPKH